MTLLTGTLGQKRFKALAKDDQCSCGVQTKLVVKVKDSILDFIYQIKIKT